MGTYLPEEMAYDQNAPVDIEETTPKAETPETQSPENPYASTGDYYGNGDNSKDTTDPEDSNDKSDKPWW